jgi:hypothetical protein
MIFQTRAERSRAPTLTQRSEVKDCGDSVLVTKAGFIVGEVVDGP